MYTPYETALNRVLESAKPLTETERVPLADAIGRVLAEEILADRDIPPFNRVAMDGYACRRADLPGPFVCLETVPAGKAPEREVTVGNCSKVMTGCPLPEGADMVFQVELSSVDDNGLVSFTGDPKTFKSTNIAARGEDMPKGAPFVERGLVISPKVTGVLASVGASRPLVVRRPRVGVIITGDEVLEPSETPLPYQIRNSNGVQLMTQLSRVGVDFEYYGIIGDDPTALAAIFDKARHECDGVLFSGGVSMGDFDYVPEILTSRGYKILFSKVAAKPGRPTTFALSDEGWVFGMPGNPVTSFVVFENMVRPFLLKMMGASELPQSVKLPLSSAAKIKKSDRVTWIPGRITEKGEVELLPYHGSGHFHSLKSAWGLVKFDIGTDKVPQGTLVDVRPI